MSSTWSITGSAMFPYTGVYQHQWCSLTPGSIQHLLCFQTPKVSGHLQGSDISGRSQHVQYFKYLEYLSVSLYTYISPVQGSAIIKIHIMSSSSGFSETRSLSPGVGIKKHGLSTAPAMTSYPWTLIVCLELYTPEASKQSQTWVICWKILLSNTQTIKASEAFLALVNYPSVHNVPKHSNYPTVLSVLQHMDNPSLCSVL